MAIVRPSSAPGFQVKKQGGKPNGRKGGFGGAKGGSSGGKGGKSSFGGGKGVKKQGGKQNGRKGGFGGAKGGSSGGKSGKSSFGGRKAGKGGGSGKGGKGGGGAGQWMFVPAAQVQSFAAPQRSFGKGGQRFGGKGGGGKGGQKFGGKGGGKGGQKFSAPVRLGSFAKRFGGKGGGKARKGGKGGQSSQQTKNAQKGGGKGGKNSSQNPKQQKTLDKLGKIEAERKVWIGGLDKEVTRGKIYAHFKDSVKPHLFEVMPKGTACVAFKTAEDAQLAIDTFNGSDLDGKEMQVDVWTQKEKKERKEGEPREKREKKKNQKSVLKTSFLKGKKGSKVESKIGAKIKGVENTLKVWVGGMSEKTTWKQLKQHFVDSGCEVDMCDMMGKPGTACCTFKTEDEASSAVGIINGTELDEKTLKVNVWSRPERKEKKVKEEA